MFVIHPLGMSIEMSGLVGARCVHPLGVVPETTVDCLQSTVVFKPRAFSFLLVSLELVEWNHGTGGGTLSAPTGCSPRDRG